MMVKAFNLLFDPILSWQKGNRVTLVYDEDFYPFINHFTEVAIERSADVLYLFVPKDMQKSIIRKYDKNPIKLPERMGSVIRGSDIIINILNGSLATQPFRKAVLSENIGNNKSAKLAHIPGLSAEILELLTKSPFEEICRNCELMAWAIGQSKEIRIETFDRDKRSYTLLIPKLRWNDLFPPQVSSGIIEKGSWGNVPPGESFICPQSEKVSGEVCINGSFDRKVLSTDEEFVMTFKEGVMDDNIVTSSDEIRKHFDTQRENSAMVNDVNWKRFAEFGIGANPAIHTLTGNMLFDEKMANTIHVAIGDSSVFGGNISSKTHEDMVIREANVYFDSHKIIDKGVVNYDLLERWKKTESLFDDIRIDSQYVSNIKSDSIKLVNSKMYRCIEMHRRLTCVFIGEGDIAQAVKSIATQTQIGKSYTIHDLSTYIPDHVNVEDVIKLMVNYDLLTLEDPDYE